MSGSPFQESLISLHNVLDWLRRWFGSNNGSRRGNVHSGHCQLCLCCTIFLRSIQTYMNTLRPQLKFILLYLSYFDKIGR